jgi:hypothetical protein
LLVQGQTKTKQSLPSQAWSSLNEDTIGFLISNGVVANVMTESSLLLYMTETQDAEGLCGTFYT